MKSISKIRKTILLSLGVLAALVLSASEGYAQKMSNKEKASAIDSILNDFYAPQQPGAAVVVVSNGKVLLRKGYGLAALDNGTPITPDMLFGIGSNTKQFTAVAVLMLEEQGKLSVKDEITKYLPDFPTQGEKITIEHLLTHTSGIQSYSALLEWTNTWDKELTYAELTDLFKDKPLEFKPGERYKYNNSGYLLLAQLIEQVTGRPYASYLQEAVIDKAGMKNTIYGYPRKGSKVATAYTRDGDEYKKPVYMAISHLNGAGGIFSTVDDMIKWHKALSSGKLIKKENLARAQTPYTLNNGEKVDYGFGFELSSWGDKRTVEHGGRMLGYIAQTMNFPAENVQLVVLSNDDSRVPDVATVKSAAIAMGEPINTKLIKLEEKAMDAYVGVYQINPQAERVVQREGAKLYSKRSGMPKIELLPTGRDEFYLDGSLTRVKFSRNAAGNITEMIMTTRQGKASTAPKTDKPLPKEKVEIVVAEEILEQYVGAYELTPQFTLTIRREGKQLIAQGTGQPAFEIYPESATKFFVKVMEAELEFTKKDGAVDGLVFSQRGRSMAARKIE